MAWIVLSSAFGWYTILSLALVIATIALVWVIIMCVMTRRRFAEDARCIRKLNCAVKAQQQQICILQADVLRLEQLPLIQSAIGNNPCYFELTNMPKKAC